MDLLDLINRSLGDDAHRSLGHNVWISGRQSMEL